MFGNFLSGFKSEPAKTADTQTRRAHARRSCDKCVSLIDNKLYPVLDWSMGGVQITCDERVYAVGQELDVALKFQLRGDIIDIPHKGRVVRKNKSRIALEFLPLTKEIRDRFQNIVDDYIAREFADSQLA